MRKFDSQSGLGVIVYVLGMVAILAFGAMIMASQSQSDQRESQQQTQISLIGQQADKIRTLIRQCAGQMRRDGITTDSPQALPIDGVTQTQPFTNYPDCVTAPNVPGTGGTCFIAGNGSELVSSVENINCPATGRYIFDEQQGVFNLPPVPGFGRWSYRKVASDGVFIRIDPTTTNDMFRTVVNDVKNRFGANELATDTLSANPNYIQIYVFRTQFPPSGPVVIEANPSGGFHSAPPIPIDGD